MAAPGRKGRTSANRAIPEFDYMTRESPFVPVDGELFWSDQGFDGRAARGKGVDGLNAAVRMRLHHYSSFSLAHSYSEREGKPYSIDHWLSTPITSERPAAGRDARRRRLVRGWLRAAGDPQPVRVHPGPPRLPAGTAERAHSGTGETRRGVHGGD